MLYNSAIAISPSGQLVCHYRKINVETLWASPGPAVQDNVFLTPWGGVGLLICSDVYPALLPRVTALKGASLILLPTNWPLSEYGYPQQLIRLRALENGAWLLVANRGGQEEELDFSKAKSYLADSSGQILKSLTSGVDNRVRSFEIPLNDDGVIEDNRVEVLSTRQSGQYHRVYGDLTRVKNLSSYLELPAPGYLDVHALAPGRVNAVEFLEKVIDSFRPGDLVLLPQAVYNDEALRRIIRLSKKAKVGIFASKNANGLNRFVTSRPIGSQVKSNFSQWPVYDYGTARIMMADLAALKHPELALAAAKEGVDLILCSAEDLTKEDILTLTHRTIEQVAIAAAAPQSALVTLIPQGRGRGRGVSVLAGQVCTYTVDTNLTRFKIFQDRVDFETLFKSPIPTSPWTRTHP
jgi:predicted amidohydrolase